MGFVYCRFVTDDFDDFLLFMVLCGAKVLSEHGLGDGFLSLYHKTFDCWCNQTSPKYFSVPRPPRHIESQKSGKHSVYN